MTREDIRELSEILGPNTNPSSMTLARMVLDLHRELEETRMKVAWHEREAYRLRRIETSFARFQNRLESKTKALEFSIRRQEVLRRQLSCALGGESYRPRYLIQRKVEGHV